MLIVTYGSRAISNTCTETEGPHISPPPISTPQRSLLDMPTCQPQLQWMLQGLGGNRSGKRVAIVMALPEAPHQHRRPEQATITRSWPRA